MPNLILEHQSAFLFDRLISDNIFVAFETLHSMRNHNKGKSGFMALKLDMSKAYDRLEWEYMKRVMINMGFHDRWIHLMMMCITIASYSMIINREPHGHITPTRGLRQEDPLSPYFFLMCTEGLHGLISKAAHNGDIRGVSLCWNGPRITHLFFADDSLLFCRAREEECQSLLEVLANYERAFGQQINRIKTTIFFSKSTNADTQITIQNLLGVIVVRHYEKYLELPSLVGRNKKESFTYIKQQVWKRIQGWEGKLLSQAGREILIKAVAQSLPTYTRACFKLPTSLCHDLESMICRFFWGQRGDNRKIH